MRECCAVRVSMRQADEGSSALRLAPASQPASTDACHQRQRGYSWPGDFGAMNTTWPNKALELTAAAQFSVDLIRSHHAVVPVASTLPAAVAQLGR